MRAKLLYTNIYEKTKKGRMIKMSINRTNEEIKRLNTISMLCAIIFVLGLTPLGLIPTPLVKATILHIPVIIGACLIGPKAGAVLGGVFGLMSFINNSFIVPGIASFAFTPIYSFDPKYSGNLWSLFICFIPRILVGVFAGMIFNVFRKVYKNKKTGFAAGAAVAGIIGTMTNTILVLGFIGIFFGPQFSEVRGKTIMAIIISTVGTNGIAELVLAALIVPAVVVPLSKYLKRI